MRTGAQRRSVYAELFPGHHRRVLDYCRLSGRQWHLLPEIEQGTGCPAAGAVKRSTHCEAVPGAQDSSPGRRSSWLSRYVVVVDGLAMVKPIGTP